MQALRTFLFKLMIERFPFVFNVYRRVQNWCWFFKKPRKNRHGYFFVGRKDMETDEFESAEVGVLLDCLREGVTDVVNVGANCGYYSCLARSLGKHVIAIEPLPLNFRLLLRNFVINGWNDVEAYPVGISNNPGITKLFGASTQASLIPGWSSDNSGHYSLIPVTTLDLLLGDRLNGKKAIFIIDIEGAEYNLLKGAIRQLKIQPRPTWFVEICAGNFQPKGTLINPTLLPTFEIFWQHGYTCHMLAEKRVPIERTQVIEWSQGKNLPRFYNFIFQ
jgi:FkbM family methyltransferase